ncbi:STAS domain-containing protein [Rhodobacter ferrooxidans]|uniref:STAS domain-containing protein n=1 Tax=Rhodobacter ferrooxidans TaxID=371731 RepID=UPI0002E82573|nr:STAS domain-containing protein [Rhodobacter sp. SW2]
MTLPADANIHQAEPLAAQILAALGQVAPLQIDTAAVESLDLAVVQILVAAHRQANRMGKRMSVALPEGSAFATALADFGILNPANAQITVQDGFWTGVHSA